MRPVAQRLGWVLIVLGVATAAAAVVVSASAAAPLQVTVNTKLDIVGTANSNTHPDCHDPCSLRKAVQFANSRRTGGTIINLPAGDYVLTEPVPADADTAAGGDLELVVDGIQIVGAGAATTIIEQSHADAHDVQDRVFDIQSTVRISGVTVRGGTAVADPSYPGNVGGGILVYYGSLDLSNSVVTGNRAILGSDPQAVGGYGGGIALMGSFRPPSILHDVTISNNVADASGAGVYASTPNTIYNSTIASNHCLSLCDGGGIYATSELHLLNDTIDGNNAQRGGGLYSYSGPTSATNVTFSSNSLNPIILGQARPRAARNVATPTPLRGAAVMAEAFGSTSATLTSSIVNGNPLDECAQIEDTTSPKGPPLASGGSNIDDGLSCLFTAAGDKQATSAGLGPLADNGGATRTRAIGPTSPAADAVAGPCPPPSRDQRGILRASAAARTGTKCDIGAFEYQAADTTPSPSPSPSFTVQDVVIYVPYVPTLPRAGITPKTTGTPPLLALGLGLLLLAGGAAALWRSPR
ncbi:MAG: choice-of-anchor Q domain-containing protein [Candidatus Dormibacteria bacterium]